MTLTERALNAVGCLLVFGAALALAVFVAWLMGWLWFMPERVM